MDDFLVVPNSHRYITRADVVLRNTVAFLKTGRFIDADRALAAGCPWPGGTEETATTCP